MIDPRQLEALTAISQEGSLARAATRLGWSQPTVDYHLSALETRVGAPLVRRSTRGSTLTPAGRVLADRGAALLTLAEQAITEARDVAQLGKPRLRFGAFPTAAARLLPGIATHLRGVGVELTAVLEEIAPLVSGIHQHTLDAALVYTAHGHELPFRSGVTVTHVLTDPLLLAVPTQHPAAARTEVTADQLTRFDTMPWVFSATPGDTLDDVVREAFAAAGTSFEVSVRTDDYSVALALVAAGLGMALVPQFAISQPPADVALRRIDDARFARDILLAVPDGSEVPAAVLRQLAEAIRRTLLSIQQTDAEART